MNFEETLNDLFKNIDDRIIHLNGQIIANYELIQQSFKKIKEFLKDYRECQITPITDAGINMGFAISCVPLIKHKTSTLLTRKIETFHYSLEIICLDINAGIEIERQYGSIDNPQIENQVFHEQIRENILNEKDIISDFLIVYRRYYLEY